MVFHRAARKVGNNFLKAFWISFSLLKHFHALFSGLFFINVLMINNSCSTLYYYFYFFHQSMIIRNALLSYFTVVNIETLKTFNVWQTLIFIATVSLILWDVVSSSNYCADSPWVLVIVYNHITIILLLFLWNMTFWIVFWYFINGTKQ